PPGALLRHALFLLDHRLRPAVGTGEYSPRSRPAAPAAAAENDDRRTSTMLKRSGSLAIGIIALVALAACSAYAQTGKCQGAKMKAAGKKAGCLLKVHSKAAAKALPLDTTKITGCETK